MEIPVSRSTRPRWRRTHIRHELLGTNLPLAAVGTGAEGEMAGGPLGTRVKDERVVDLGRVDVGGGATGQTGSSSWHALTVQGEGLGSQQETRREHDGPARPTGEATGPARWQASTRSRCRWPPEFTPWVRSQGCHSQGESVILVAMRLDVLDGAVSRLQHELVHHPSRRRTNRVRTRDDSAGPVLSSWPVEVVTDAWLRDEGGHGAPYARR
jgi:hypothetical protein